MPNQFTPVKGANTLKNKFPKLVKEFHKSKNSIDLSNISYGSNKKVWWVCSKGHEYEMPIKSRTHKTKPQGCPYCSGTRVGYGNDLRTKYPNIAKEWNQKKNKVNPSKYTSHSGLKVWWVCSEGHEYEMRIAARTDKKNPQGCSYCAGKKVGYGNDLKSKYPKLAKQWDADKNKDKPNEIIAGSKKKRWFLCKKGHSFETEVYALVNKPDKCPYCSNKKAGYGNDLKTNYPEIAKEWNYKKNDTNPENHLPQTNKKVWWICSKKHEYEMLIGSRTAKRYQQGCPYCSNKKVGYGNDLKTNYPEIAKEWNYEKNSIRPEEVVPLSVKKAWFKCKNNHDHYQTIAVKVKGHDCPYCTGNLIGYGNDLKSNYPDIAKEWDYKKNNMKPEDVGPRSGKKAWWICQNGHSFDQVIADRTREDIEIGCRFCRLTPRSREEIYLAYELKKFFNINLEDQRVVANKEYDVDIVIRDKKIIIEYDGYYWHKDNQVKDISKTKDLVKHGWTVIRVREKPLNIISSKYNISANPMDYKETSNKVLKKIKSLGYEIQHIEKYIKRKTLINKKIADKFMLKLLQEKNK